MCNADGSATLRVWDCAYQGGEVPVIKCFGGNGDPPVLVVARRAKNDCCVIPEPFFERVGQGQEVPERREAVWCVCIGVMRGDGAAKASTPGGRGGAQNFAHFTFHVHCPVPSPMNEYSDGSRGDLLIRDPNTTGAGGSLEQKKTEAVLAQSGTTRKPTDGRRGKPGGVPDDGQFHLDSVRP
eukprot:gene9175-biopygen7183